MISDTKVSKITQKPLFYKAFTVWDVDAAGSNPVTPTISSVHNGFQLWALDFFMLKLLFSFLCMYRSRFSAPFCFALARRLCRQILYSNTLSGFSGVITFSVTAGDFDITHKAVVNHNTLCSVLACPFCLIDFNSVYKFVK